MKNRIAKFLRDLAEKLSPSAPVVQVTDGPYYYHTPVNVLKLQKLKADVRLTNPLDQREREEAERKLREDIVRQAAEGVQIEMYNQHVRAYFYFYA